MRHVTVCLFEEVASGCWGIGGHTPTTDVAKRRARLIDAGRPCRRHGRATHRSPSELAGALAAASAD